MPPLTLAIWNARSNWRDIGRALRVSSDVMNEIGVDHCLQNDGQRMERVLVEWLHSGKATVHQLLRALEERSVRHYDIAKNIRSLEGEDRTAIGLCGKNCSLCKPLS